MQIASLLSPHACIRPISPFHTEMNKAYTRSPNAFISVENAYRVLVVIRRWQYDCGGTCSGVYWSGRHRRRKTHTYALYLHVQGVNGQRSTIATQKISRYRIYVDIRRPFSPLLISMCNKTDCAARIFAWLQPGSVYQSRSHAIGSHGRDSV